MPWSEATSMDQEKQFIADYLRYSLSMSKLYKYNGNSRNTGYKFVQCYIRHYKRLNGFNLPGQRKVDTQWTLYCLVHHIEKLAHHGYAQ